MASQLPSAESQAQELPSEVVNCLENARFLHLATSHNDIPHVSLMNYTYLPHTPFRNAPTIIMTTPPSSKKTTNLYSNPRVSLLVHDWVSHRPPTLSSSPGSTGIDLPDPQGGRSSLASLLYGLNSASISRISVSINGTAQFLPAGSDEEAWCKTKHKEHNTFGDTGRGQGLLGDDADEADGGAGCYIESQDVRVLVVTMLDGRISDQQGEVKDWKLQTSHGNNDVSVNGVTSS